MPILTGIHLAMKKEMDRPKQSIRQREQTGKS
jgi:hypothetical protein